MDIPQSPQILSTSQMKPPLQRTRIKSPDLRSRQSTDSGLDSDSSMKAIIGSHHALQPPVSVERVRPPAAL